MNTLDIPEENIGHPAPQSIRFLKNEEGKREAHEFPSPERESEEGQKIRERGIILVGHIDQGRTSLVEALLQAHDFSGEVILIEGDAKDQELGGIHMSHSWAHPWRGSLEEMLNTQMIITARQIDDLGEMLLDRKTPASQRFSTTYVPKTHKSKAKIMRKHTQKKK